MHYDPLISSRAKFFGQLGTRLGRADPDRRLPRLGTVQFSTTENAARIVGNA